jgi:hypothetical protein
MIRRLLSAGYGSKKRLWITSALLSVLVLTPFTYAMDAAGGHPAKSAPIVLWIVWTLVVVGVRAASRSVKQRSSRPAK